MRVSCVLACLVVLFLPAYGLKVLGVLPFGSNSHFTVGHSILKALLRDGHEITTISPYPQKKPVPNYRDIDASSILKLFKKDQISNAFMLGEMHPMVLLSFLFKLGEATVEAYMQHPEVIKLMKSKEKFDVCVIENFNADAFVGIAEHFDCVLISYTTFGVIKWVDQMTSNQSPYSYVPHPYTTYTDKMTFVERLLNTVQCQYENIIFKFVHLPNQKRLYDKYFPNAKRSFDEMYKSAAIHFLNNHVSSATVRPYLPNMIEIGGIHVEPAKPLPKDIQEFLDSATDGVILFSMGSMLQGAQWPVNQREAFVKVFGKLKEKVLWKYENETLPNKPDNVMISSWIPQRDILAHPNIKLFITHGGLLGTTEALVEGVPVIGIPVYGDQKMNIIKAERSGYGLQVPLEEVSEQKLSAALKEILSNPKYTDNAKMISSRFVDRPMTPQETVVFWTKFAVRHKGASHLRAAANDLSYIEFHLLDVYLTLIGIFFFFLFINYKMFKFLLSCAFGKTKEKTN